MLVSKGVMGQAQVTFVKWKYLKFFSFKRCSKGGKQQCKTNPDNPKICPSVTIKDFNKRARKTPKRRTYCNELFSVSREEKAPVFNTAERKTSRHWSQLSFSLFLFFETINHQYLWFQNIPLQQGMSQPNYVLHRKKKSLSSIYLKPGICSFFWLF